MSENLLKEEIDNHSERNHAERKVYVTPDKLSPAGRVDLHEFLVANKGEKIEIDLQKTSRILSLDAQVLAVAKSFWAASGVELRISNVQERARKDFMTLGFFDELLNEGEDK